jgi:ribonuclease III
LSRRAALEKRIGHRFSTPQLLEDALARGTDARNRYERLEFLGDGVLACVTAEALHARFADIPEGSLHRLREKLIREETLARLAHDLGLDELLRLSMPQSSDAALADTVEALFGAIFLDGGYPAAKAAILKALEPLLGQLDPERLDKDAKSRLQEIVQGRFKTVPAYRLLTQSGKAHQLHFEIECVVAELGLSAKGSGSSRQRAEQEAAAAMLGKLSA